MARALASTSLCPDFLPTWLQDTDDSDATRTLPRIFLRVARDGTHVELDIHAPVDAIECSRRAHQYLDVVGRDGDAAGGLTVLHNVRAASGAATRPTARTRRLPGASAGRCVGGSPGRHTYDRGSLRR